MTLVVEKEESLVTLLIDTRNVNWAAYRNPKLIAVRIRLRRPLTLLE